MSTDKITSISSSPESSEDSSSKGLETLTDEQRKEAIQLFRQEVDTPYRVVMDPTNFDFYNFPDCVGKSLRLHDNLKRIGVETHFGICDYRWSDVDLPLEVLKEPHEDIGVHMCLLYKFTNPNTDKLEWRILDPTWHPGIRISFGSNGWDGVHGTPLAVVPTTLIERVDPEDTATMAELEFFDKDAYVTDLKINALFYEALNRHFEYLEAKNKELGDKSHHPSERKGYPYGSE